MKYLPFLAALAMAASACSSSNDFEKGKKILEQQGYREIKNTGYEMFCCSEDDGYSTGFEAKAQNGEIIKGCFCSSLGKGVTIRFE